MNFTEEDITKLGESFKKSLRHGQAELGQNAPTISQMQSWMIKHNVEHPEVFKTMVNKLGTGTRAGKKNMP